MNGRAKGGSEEAVEPQAAIPEYAGTAFGTAPPGHRFRLYFQGWDEDWRLVKTEKQKVLTQAGEAARSGYPALVKHLQERQLVCAQAAGDGALVLRAQATAPFVTGVGSEHPLENGFAFLDPYGVPYLPGSSIKGVMRRAAEDLALFESGSPWNLLAVWWLFGFDATSAFVGDSQALAGDLDQIRHEWRAAYEEACRRLPVDDAAHWLEAAADRDIEKKWRDDPVGFLRTLDAANARKLHLGGSLRFWDAVIDPGGADLRVDIMNPHHQPYYQRSRKTGRFEAPGDFRNPNPIFFLAVPPGAKLTFVVELAPVQALPSRLRDPNTWQALVRSAFRHACTWLGFGAKTAIGYGAFDPVDVPAAGAGDVRKSGAGSAASVATAAATVRRPAIEAFLMELNAIPPARLAGSIGPLVDRALAFPDREDQRAAARAIVERFGIKDARKKARDNERWRRVLELADLGT